MAHDTLKPPGNVVGSGRPWRIGYRREIDRRPRPTPSPVDRIHGGCVDEAALESEGAQWSVVADDCHRHLRHSLRDVGTVIGTPPSADSPRTLHVCHGLAVGGLERLVVDLSRMARARGHDDRILTFDSHRLRIERDIDPEGVPVTHLPRRRGLDVTWPLRMAAHLRRARPAVVHAHNDTAACYVAVARRILAPRHRPRFIVTFHNLPVHDTGWARLATRAACRMADRVIAVSSDLANRLRISGWTDRATPLRHGIDLSRFVPRDEPGSSSRLRVGMMARVVPGKLHQILIRAVQELEASNPHIELVLAGDGPCAPEVDRRITGLHHGSRIARVHDVATFLRSLDVAALLSLHEGSPRSLMEAFASGLPTIASAVGGIMELTGATPPCILVRNEVPAVVAALRELQDARIRRSLGKLARSHAEATFGLEQTLESYDRLYVGGDES